MNRLLCAIALLLIAISSATASTPPAIPDDAIVLVATLNLPANAAGESYKPLEELLAHRNATIVKRIEQNHTFVIVLHSSNPDVADYLRNQIAIRYPASSTRALDAVSARAEFEL